MSTILVNAPFAAPDGTTIADYTSVIGGAWSELLGFEIPFPVNGSITDFSITSNTLRNVPGSSMLLGAEGGQGLPDNFTLSVSYALLALGADHVFDLVFCASSGSPSFGYDLEVYHAQDPGTTRVTLYKFENDTFTELAFAELSTVAEAYREVAVDCQTTAGVITVRLNGDVLFTVNDTSPFSIGGSSGLNFSPSSSTLMLRDFSMLNNGGGGGGGSQTYLSPIGSAWQSFTNGGIPLAGGKLYSFIAGTTTPIATYADPQGTIENLNPIVLDSAGRVPNQIRFLAGDTVKLHLTDADGNVIWTEDNLEGINDVATGGGGTTVDFWINFGVTPVRASDTSFSITGNWSSVLHFERRVQLYQSSGPIYGTVLSCSVTEPTPGNFVSTVVIRPDSGTVHSDVSIGYYSSIDSIGSPVPQPYALELRVAALEADNAVLHSQITNLQSQINTINATLPMYATRWDVNANFMVTSGFVQQTETFVYPPGGFSMADLAGFIPSMRRVDFAGRVDYNDTMVTEYQIEPTRIRIFNQNSEQRATSWVNWLAIWRKPL